MRTITPVVAVLLLLAFGVAAEAGLCKECQKRVFPADIGTCGECGGETASSAFGLCEKCSERVGRCQACGRPIEGSGPRPPGLVVEANNTFAVRLYGRLAAEEGNLFFSPASIHEALAMTLVGARGATAAAMNRALALPVRHPDIHGAYQGVRTATRSGPKATLHVANALWGQRGYPWQEPFLAVTRKCYGAGLREVDFVGDPEGARRTINGWVEEKTEERIVDLIPEGLLDPDTRLVLTNAIYFKGSWVKAFDPRKTREGDFHVEAAETVRAPFMNCEEELPYAEADGVQLLALPYAGRELSMVVLLPGEVDGLAAMERRLPELLERSRALEKRKVKVSLPRFRLESSVRLDEALGALGMGVAFTPDADFSGMNGKTDLFIGAVLHKAFVDVNEEGTEAAAATAVVMKSESKGPRIPVFRADRPFIFFIRHEATGRILFLGRVVRP